MLSLASATSALAGLSLSAFQAGGGGSFGGGGGGGGGFGGFGGGGGGGDGDGLVFLIYLVVRYPLVGIPAVILFAIVSVYGSRRGWWRHQERTIRRSRTKRRKRISRVSSNAIRAQDPAFDERRFLERVELAFHKAQKAWCDQDLEPLRAFVSDGVFERFSLQIAEQRTDGWRQGMEGTDVGKLRIVHVEAGGEFETITVRIPFESKINRLSLETNKALAGSTLPTRSFKECWSFVRRRGTKSLTGDGLIEGRCPNCGATLAINQSARCSSCDCLARSGRFDWVLTEITQSSVWTADQESAVRGFTAYAAHDPGLSVQLLEDRASVAFWRKCAADRAGTTEPLARIATEEMCASYAKRLAPSPEGLRTYAADCAVGVVRTVGIEAGDERDQALVEIVWDGRRARADASGKRRLDERRVRRKSIFVFGRRPGQTSELDDAFTTTHCRSCGAHDTGGSGSRCPYCDAPRTGDRSTWLLDEVLDAADPAARRLIAELGGSRVASASASADDLLTWAVDLVRADGRIDDDERRAIEALAERAEVPRERLEQLLADDRDGELLPEPPDLAGARAWLESLAAIALADGHVAPAEVAFLKRAAQRLGWGNYEVRQAMRRARTALYKESRER